MSWLLAEQKLEEDAGDILARERGSYRVNLADGSFKMSFSLIYSVISGFAAGKREVVQELVEGCRQRSRT